MTHGGAPLEQGTCPGAPRGRRPLSSSRRRGCGCFNRAGGVRAAPPTSWASADRAGLCLLPGRPHAAPLRRRRLAAAGGSAVPVPAAPGAAAAAGSPQPCSRRAPWAPAPPPFLLILLPAAGGSPRSGALPALTRGEVGMLPAVFPEL